jgi:hypothetical protein
LKDDDYFPVPFSEIFFPQRAAVVDPVGDEGADAVEKLPEGHYFAANMDGASSPM